jgi:hypothetical protein
MDASSRPNLKALDEGFAVREVTGNLARRQLNVSLGVMGLMLAAALAVIGGVGFSASSREPTMAKLMVQQPQFVRPMTAQAAPEAPIPPGG